MAQASQTLQDISNQTGQRPADLLIDVVEAVPVPTVLLTPDGRIRHANTAFVQMLGVENEHYLHKRFPRRWLAHPQPGLAQVRELLHHTATSGTHSMPVSLPLRSCDGSEIAVDVYARPVPGRGGDSDGLTMLTFMNVGPFTMPSPAPQPTEEANPPEFREDWEASGEKFRILFEYAPDAYYLCDLTGRFLDANKAAEEIVGFSRQEAIGKTFLALNLLSARQIPRVSRMLVQSAIGKPTGPEEFTLRRKDGSTVPVEIRTYPIRIQGQVLILGIARDITERKQAEKRLQESEQKYRQLHESSRDGCVAVDMEGRFVQSNPAFRAMLGYTEDQLRQLTYQDITLNEWRESTARIIREQVLARGCSDLYEKECVRADGTVFPVEVRAYLKKDLTGRPVGMWAIVRDVTERRKAQEELRESDERFRAMTDSAQDAIMMMDPRGRITFYNKTAQAMFGWTADEALDMDLHALIAPKRYHEAYQKGMASFRHLGTGPAIGQTLELTALHKDGTEFPIEISLAGVQLGDEWHAIGIVRDITQRKHAEEAVLKEKAFRDLVVNFLPGVFYMFDEAGHFLWWNKNLETATEYSAEEIATIHPLEMCVPDDRQLVSERIARVLSEGTATVEANLLSKTGYRTPYFLMGVRIERDGQPCVLGYGMDITERRQAQFNQERLNAELQASVRELERSNSELRDFAHITAHDLKAPLRGIGTLAEWLDQDCGDELTPESRENLRLMRQRVKRMERLVNGILRYSEIGYNDQPAEVLDTGVIVQEVIEQIAPPDHIEISIEGTLPRVRAERTRLTQVFQNLLANAAKYIDKPEGKIRVSVRDTGGFWEFSVADNGPGIEAKHFERVFRMFQSLWPDKHPDSTGLGLAVVKKVVEMYGGQVRVESELGRGSTFFFTFPKCESIQAETRVT